MTPPNLRTHLWRVCTFSPRQPEPVWSLAAVAGYQESHPLSQCIPQTAGEVRHARQQIFTLNFTLQTASH